MTHMLLEEYLKELKLSCFAREYHHWLKLP